MIRSHAWGRPCHCVEVGGGRLIVTEYGPVHEKPCRQCEEWKASLQGQWLAMYRTATPEARRLLDAEPEYRYHQPGDSDDIGAWVGTPSASLWEEPPPRATASELETMGHGGVIAGVQLLADSGAPECFVVVGRLD
jgi:hypothetical protein